MSTNSDVTAGSKRRAPRAWPTRNAARSSRAWKFPRRRSTCSARSLRQTRSRTAKTLVAAISGHDKHE
jgi:hypothetical protein